MPELTHLVRDVPGGPSPLPPHLAITKDPLTMKCNRLVFVDAFSLPQFLTILNPPIQDGCGYWLD